LVVEQVEIAPTSDLKLEWAKIYERLWPARAKPENTQTRKEKAEEQRRIAQEEEEMRLRRARLG